MEKGGKGGNKSPSPVWKVECYTCGGERYQRDCPQGRGKGIKGGRKRKKPIPELEHTTTTGTIPSLRVRGNVLSLQLPDAKSASTGMQTSARKERIANMTTRKIAEIGETVVAIARIASSGIWFQRKTAMPANTAKPKATANAKAAAAKAEATTGPPSKRAMKRAKSQLKAANAHVATLEAAAET